MGSWLPHQISNLCPLQWRCHQGPPGKTLQCFFIHSPGRPPSLNTLALSRFTATFLPPGFLLCVPTLSELYTYIFKKFKFIYFNWRLITLQYCIAFAIHEFLFVHVSGCLAIYQGPAPNSAQLFSSSIL